jgi:hypothetical protein
MGNLNTFNPSPVQDLIDGYGLEMAWLNMLYTRIATSKSSLHYILRDSKFKKCTVLNEDVLNDLTIGEISVIYEYSVAYIDSSSRKENGQFFTPDDVAIFMASQASDFPEGKWLDPCAGIGNLSWHLVNSQSDPEKFLISKMVLSDKDPFALFIARVLFTLSFQKRRRNLFNEIESNFVEFDFLSVAETDSFILFAENSLAKIPVHDYVIVNPPYLSISGEDNRFETAKARDLYAYFLENIIKSSTGFISVTPQSFTNAKKFEPLRKLLLNNFSYLRIYAFDNIPGNIFFGIKFGSSNSNSANSIRAAITIADKERKGNSITSLLRWKSSERSDLFINIDSFLASPLFTSEFFPKVSSRFLPLYRLLARRPRLESIVSKSPTEYALFIPSAPRYFISALMKPVSRTSLKTIYFKNESDRLRAYLLLNSSVMYWWWRVRDGGMTLSLESILSVPIPEFSLSKPLIKELKSSEDTNIVYKLNAGSLQENVKHDPDLISRLNTHIVPRYADRLILCHENSELIQIKPKRNRQS